MSRFQVAQYMLLSDEVGILPAYPNTSWMNFPFAWQ